MKRVTSFILSAVVLTLLFCQNTFAATTYDLKVGNIQVTSDNASKITDGFIYSGYCKYNASTKTLTFVNAVIDMGKSGYPAVESKMSNLYIEFEGDNNKVKSEASPGFVFKNSSNIYFKGNSKSKLTIDMASSTSTYSAISIESGNLTINQMEMYFEDSGNTSIALYGNNSAKVSIQESKMMFYSGNSSFSHIYAFQSISLRSCYPSNATFKNGYFYKSDGTLLKGGSLFIYPTLSIGRTMLNTERILTYTSTDIPAISQGEVGYDPQSKVLRLDNAIINSDQNYDGISENIENLTIKLYGQNGITTNTSNYAIRANQTMTISGENAKSSSLAIIAQKGIFMLGKELNVENATLAIIAGNDAIRGYWGGSTLNINKSEVSVYTNEGVKAVYDFKACNLTNCYVTMPENGYYDTSTKAFVNANGETANQLTIETPSETYPVYILGHQLNNLNKDNFTCEGLTGKVNYDPDTKTLTLTDVSMNSSANDGYGIIFSQASDYNLLLSGTNTITTLKNAIHSVGNLTIRGSSSLIAKSTGENGLWASGDIRLQAGAKLSFEGKQRGICGNASHNLYVIYVNSSTDYYLKGQEGAYFGGQILFSTMDFCSHPDYGTPGCYYNASTNSICQNGGVEVCGDMTVNFYHVSTYHDIYVGGVRVTNANRQGIGSPYIKTGGGTAVSYDSNSNSLILDGAEIIMDENEHLKASLLENGKANLKIQVKNNSRLESHGSSSSYEDVNFTAKTFIIGPGKLTIVNDGVRSAIQTSDALIFSDANVETSGGIYGKQQSKTLTASNSTVKVNKGGIGGFGALRLDNGTKIQQPAGGYFSNGYVRDANGNIAATVLLAGSLKGDVNLDGDVNISDIVAVINTMAGDTTFKATADVNGDNAIDISDIIAIINIMAEQK